MTEVRQFRDIRKGASSAEALPVDDFMAELEQLQADLVPTRNLVWQAVADGTLSLDYLKRFCKEYYFLGVWYTSEFGSLVANAPDIDALTLDESEHFVHWTQNLADETGFAGDRNHVDMKVEWARMLDISDERAREDLARVSVTALSFVAQSARGLGRPAVPQKEIDKAQTIVERFMKRWRGEPDPRHVKAVDAYFISAAEHGMNASTFTARIVASTGADAAACISSGIGALSGPLHGGAPSRVLSMLEAVERSGDA